MNCFVCLLTVSNIILCLIGSLNDGNSLSNGLLPLYVSVPRGGSRIFGGGGGAQNIMCAYVHHEREARSPLGQGPGPA